MFVGRRAAGQGSEFARWVQSTLNQVLGIQLAIDGVMGPATRSAIRDFQKREGLPVDGIVGPQTRDALIEAQGGGGTPSDQDQADTADSEYFDQELLGELTEEEWEDDEWDEEVDRASRAYIRWVQSSLNRLMGLKLAVDGIAGAQTSSAVRSFQKKFSLTVDGVVGPQTEAMLVMLTATPPPQSTAARGRRGPSAGVNTPLPQSGSGFYNKHGSNRRSYGLPETIQALVAIGRAWHKKYPNGPRIGIGDISFRGGGPMPPHKSHQKGVDIDIRLPRNDGKETPVRYQSSAYSRGRTQDLVNMIRANGILRVQYVFFNDPAVKGVQPQSGHDDHLHVRFFKP